MYANNAGKARGPFSPPAAMGKKPHTTFLAFHTPLLTRWVPTCSYRHICTQYANGQSQFFFPEVLKAVYFPSSIRHDTPIH